MNDKSNEFRDDRGDLITYEQWEERVWRAARSFSVNVPLGRAKLDTKWYRTYPEALMIALHTPRAILYASTAEGRAVCIARKDWARYLALYNKLTGQRLKMPADPLAIKAEREEPAPKRKRIRTKKG